MSRFSHFLAIDWSGARGERHKGIALALADEGQGPPRLIDRGKPWSREEVLAFLRDDLPRATLVGMDLGIALPFADCGAFFPGWEHSPPDAKALWALADALCAEDPHLEAGGVLRHPVLQDYFRHGRGAEGARFHAPYAATREGRFRVAEEAQRAMGCRPVSNFNLVGAAQVGKSSLTGMRLLHRLDGALPVWPVDPLPRRGSVLVEIYTALASLEALPGHRGRKVRDHALLNEGLDGLGSPPVEGSGAIDDHSADALLTAAWLRRNGEDAGLWAPRGLTRQIARTEGWTFGAR
ncbi:hypothetical protein [Alteriqipengyuania lutimaris]|uniref:DUF429 domain-containing protein n=1 Tax=Alteriqipengyuania lutimaris TaxID=1538146 RepID=A0A395LLH8_9SPHN|nr:hypothetical protein [Alteriqipengyuania lutimaris]MBB3033356.1 hypothetical protein [Alteriqipengyuania lutimaris]RDS77615.1 hypothetical protein DL238_08365 [Alteriqipengyuania lutimaris]